jgi:hypothetical protein
MALLDGDRFEGRFRDGVHAADVSDLMRRMVKEGLLKFDGTPPDCRWDLIVCDEAHKMSAGLSTVCVVRSHSRLINLPPVGRSIFCRSDGLGTPLAAVGLPLPS